MASAALKKAVLFSMRRGARLGPAEARRGLSSEHVTVGGQRIHIVREGKGPHPLLLLPGPLGSAQTHFAPQLAGFDKGGGQ